MSDRLDDDRVIDDALDAWTPLEPPTGFADRVLAARAEAPAKRPWWLAAPISAVAVVALVVLVAQSRSGELSSDAVRGAPSEGVAAAGSANAGSAVGVAMNQPIGSDAGVMNGQLVAVDDPETDVAVIAGTSVTIHDPAVTTTLHVDFSGRCSSGAHVVVLGPQSVEVTRVAGHTRATLALDEGRWSYEVRCDADPHVPPITGTITVRGDGTSRELPKTGDDNSPVLFLEDIRSSGSEMTVRGATLPGWTLAIDGDPITIRKDLRFEARTRGFKRIVIRAEHPSLGVHYFATLPITR